MTLKTTLLIGTLIALGACERLGNIGQEPEFTPILANQEHKAMLQPSLPTSVSQGRQVDQASLWNASRQSLLGDRRAGQPNGPVLAVKI